MTAIKSWWALLVREYLEHRMSFFYFPLGIVGLLVLSGASAFGLHRVRVAADFPVPPGVKVFELGYLVLLGLWFAYLSVTLFFYFGDAFAADRRNNAMFFWKSMPVSDLKILASKFLAGTTLFPAIVLAVGVVTGLLFYLFVNLATFFLPAFVPPSPLEALQGLLNITGFGIVYFALALLWYAPFLAWVGALSTAVGRWSLPLAFVIPGLISVVENIAFFGNVPRGGFVWNYLSHRWQFGLNEVQLGFLFASPIQFEASTYVELLVKNIDWFSMLTGLVFAALVVWLASEYRRRRIS